MADLNRSQIFDVSRYVAVVTGGASGIGLMCAEALAENGAKVYIVGRREEALKTAAKEYSRSQGKIIPVTADITSASDLQSLESHIQQQEPNGINVLINNAGQALEQTRKSSYQDIDFTDPQKVRDWMLSDGPAAWQKTFEANVTAHFFVTASLLQSLNKGRENKAGHSSSVINIGSIAGEMKSPAMGQFAYAASKAAIEQVTYNLAHALKPLKIRVNAIAPGLFPSEMTAGGSDEKQKSALQSGGNNPAGRTGQESDIAAGVLYLASKGGNFVNGRVLTIDGGQILQVPSHT